MAICGDIVTGYAAINMSLVIFSYNVKIVHQEIELKNGTPYKYTPLDRGLKELETDELNHLLLAAQSIESQLISEIMERGKMKTLTVNTSEILREGILHMFKSEIDKVTEEEIKETHKRVEQRVRDLTTKIILRVQDFYSLELHGTTVRIEVKNYKSSE